MPRELNDRDIELLKKVAPECSDLVCSGSGLPFRSILPPLANHFATDAGDFQERLERLSPEDLEYLITLIRDGDESMGCVPPEYAGVFVDLVAGRLGKRAAAEVAELYAESESCPD
jgi:hypothetical protein